MNISPREAQYLANSSLQVLSFFPSKSSNLVFSINNTSLGFKLCAKLVKSSDLVSGLNNTF